MPIIGTPGKTPSCRPHNPVSYQGINGNEGRLAELGRLGPKWHQPHGGAENGKGKTRDMEPGFDVVYAHGGVLDSK